MATATAAATTTTSEREGAPMECREYL